MCAAAEGRHVCYVVNELSSQVAIFQYHPEVAAEIDNMFARTAPQLRTELLRSCKPTHASVVKVAQLTAAHAPTRLRNLAPLLRDRAPLRHSLGPRGTRALAA